MNQGEKFDTIDIYLWSTPPLEERTAFEKEQAIDKDIAKEVMLRQL